MRLRGKKQLLKTLILLGAYIIPHVFATVTYPDYVPSLVPVLAVGFDDLAQRVEAQTQQSAAHTQTLEVHLHISPTTLLLLPAYLRARLLGSSQASHCPSNLA
jgi:hypothetical protein